MKKNIIKNSLSILSLILILVAMPSISSQKQFAAASDDDDEESERNNNDDGDRNNTDDNNDDEDNNEDNDDDKEDNDDNSNNNDNRDNIDNSNNKTNNEPEPSLLIKKVAPEITTYSHVEYGDIIETKTDTVTRYETKPVITQTVTMPKEFQRDTDGDFLVDAIDPDPTTAQWEYFTDSDEDGVPNVYDKYPNENDFSFYEQGADANNNGLVDSYERLAK